MDHGNFNYVQVPIGFKSENPINGIKQASQVATIKDIKVVVNYDVPALKRGKPKSVIPKEDSDTFDNTKTVDIVLPKPKVNVNNSNHMFSAQAPKSQYGIVPSRNRSIVQDSMPIQAIHTSGIELPKPLYQMSSAAVPRSKSVEEKRKEDLEKEEIDRQKEIEKQEERVAVENMIILPPVVAYDQISEKELNDYLASAKSEKPESTYTKQLNLYKATVDAFFFHKLLIIGNNVCRIAELEVYKTPDPYIPHDFQLLTSSKFYFHRRRADKYAVIANPNSLKITKNGEYSKGSKRGLYITMGSNTSGGAMLIRSIYICGKIIDGKVVFNNSRNNILKPDDKGKEELHGEENVFVEDPGNVVKYILTNLKHKGIDGLVLSLKAEASKYGYVYSNDSPIDINLKCLPLHILDYDFLTVEPKISTAIYNGPRVGLSLEKFQRSVLDRTNTQESYSAAQYTLNQAMYYLMIPYRFTCMPAELKQYKHYFAMEAKRQFIPDAKITTDFKLDGELLAKWMRFFNKGSDMTLDSFLTPDYLKLDANNNVIIQLYAFGFFSKFIDSMI